MLRSIWENFDWLAQAVANEDISLTGIRQSKEVYFSVCYCPIWEMRKIFKQMGNMRSCKPLPCLSPDGMKQLRRVSSLPYHSIETPWCCELREGPFCMESSTQGQQPGENTAKSCYPRQSLMKNGLRHPRGFPVQNTPPGRTEMLLISDAPKVSGCSSACLCGNNSSSLLPLRLLADVSFH